MIAKRGSSVSVDVERFRLRRFLDDLETIGELERRPEPTALADVARILDGNPKAVLFESAGPERLALAGNVLASRRRFARAFGVEPDKLLGEVMRRLRTKPQFVEVASQAAPVQEIVQTGADVDVTALPAHLQHAKDGGPYISAAIDISIDPTTELPNVGMRRLMVRGRAETGIDLTAPSDLRAIYRAAVERRERLPISIVVGSHPIDYLAATMRVPGDELGLMASLRDAPLPLVKCVTNDLFVPADAEWVLEGYVGEEGYVEPEGPYGEALGFYGGMKINPVFHVTAITRRRDAVFQTCSISGPKLSNTDTAHVTTLRTEVLTWRALEIAIREPVAIYAPPATGSGYTLRVAIRQRFPGEARNAIAAVFSSPANVKNVFVVDPDIDIFSDEQFEWALATRFQPDRDLFVEGGFRTPPIDPSLSPDAKTGSKAGFDLTLPLGTSGGLEAQIPTVPSYHGARFDSLRAALADGPKYFEALMAALGSDVGRDVGRDVVRGLEELRHGGLLQRDAEGRYILSVEEK